MEGKGDKVGGAQQRRDNMHKSRSISLQLLEAFLDSTPFYVHGYLLSTSFVWHRAFGLETGFFLF